MSARRFHSWPRRRTQDRHEVQVGQAKARAVEGKPDPGEGLLDPRLFAPVEAHEKAKLLHAPIAQFAPGILPQAEMRVPLAPEVEVLEFDVLGVHEVEEDIMIAVLPAACMRDRIDGMRGIAPAGPGGNAEVAVLEGALGLPPVERSRRR